MFSLEGAPGRRDAAYQERRHRHRVRLGPLALGAIRAARRARLSVPGDVSVVGYDDSAFMNCTDPPLTTVRQPIEAIGRAAVAMLTAQIEGAAIPAEELFFEPGNWSLAARRRPRRSPLPSAPDRFTRCPGVGARPRVRLPSPQSEGKYLAMYCRTLCIR